MTRLLSLVGLMRVSEHEEAKLQALADEQRIALRDTNLATARETISSLTALNRDLEAKYKRAVADLEKQAGEIAALREANSSLASGNALLSKEVIALRPDALAMRRKRQMDRDRRKGRG